MNYEFEPEPHHRVLNHRLNDAFTPTYLTILSIIQAVALTDLATVVAAEYRQFTVVNWLLALLTFGVLIIVWNVYSIQGTIWRWIPDVGMQPCLSWSVPSNCFSITRSRW